MCRQKAALSWAAATAVPIWYAFERSGATSPRLKVALLHTAALATATTPNVSRRVTASAGDWASSTSRTRRLVTARSVPPTRQHDQAAGPELPSGSATRSTAALGSAECPLHGRPVYRHGRAHAWTRARRRATRAHPAALNQSHQTTGSATERVAGWSHNSHRAVAPDQRDDAPTATVMCARSYSRCAPFAHATWHQCCSARECRI